MLRILRRRGKRLMDAPSANQLSVIMGVARRKKSILIKKLYETEPCCSPTHLTVERSNHYGKQ